MTFPADIVLTGGKVRTMDAKKPLAEALAITGGKIIAIGSDDEIMKFANNTTRRIEVDGRVVLPGLQDTHIHFLQSSTDYFHSALLHEASTVDELLDIIRIFAAENPEKSWIRGIGFSSGLFTPDQLTKERLDEVTGGRPAIMLANDYHNGWANTTAFNVAGVSAGSADPVNGQYVRNEDGSPKGWIIEDAIWAMAHLAPSFGEEDYLSAIKHYSKIFNSRGITGVLDALVNRKSMAIYKKSFEQGDLTVRVCATAKVFAHKPLNDQLEELKSLRLDFHGDWVRMHSAKFFVDGVLENGTACLIEPRFDTGENAPLMFSPEQINEFFCAFDKEKFQLHVHTIGDGAIHATLNGIEHAKAVNGDWDSRHQLAHLQVVDPPDIPRFKELGVLANFQTFWAQPSPDYDKFVEDMIGPERSQWIYPIGEFKRQGVTCMLSSDWGVTTFDPFHIMQCAVTRQAIDGPRDSPAHTPQHQITIEEAVRGYTIDAAYAAWRDDVTGSLSVGKYADLIILDQDIFEIPPQKISSTKVLLTMVEGEVVYREGFLKYSKIMA